MQPVTLRASERIVLSLAPPDLHDQLTGELRNREIVSEVKETPNRLICLMWSQRRELSVDHQSEMIVFSDAKTDFTRTTAKVVLQTQVRRARKHASDYEHENERVFFLD